ncbi:hypothetical protein NX862_17245 [Rhodobacter sp. KR11]|uniref:calcium-binding protein n=1 Tax=Rhodobacter sp. KR11 TaxID=2974588 RepID=UPI002222807D|nr:hypothetical protein [Rhodobacter sp. KR11]MCW1920509.1 hypothetical protein [Rhodobacter sp. KR11]
MILQKGTTLAVFTYFSVDSDTNSASIALDLTSLTATQFVLRDAFGAAITLTGSGLVYGTTGPIGGKITGVTETTTTGATAFSGSGFNLKATAVAQAMILAPVDDGAAAFALLTRGNDTVNGSDNEDYLTGGRGKDTLLAGAGQDVLRGGIGDDMLTGGADTDVFIFMRYRDGADVITDFADGGPTDDFIQISRLAYKNMVATEDATGVTLTLSETSSIKVLGWSLEDMGRDDFNLV